MKFEIETVALKDAPLYTALSYVWGTEEHPKLIVLAGQDFKVRTNLWTFLDTIRNRKETEHFWIDALCIDQCSNAERSHQVAMMGQIYTKAAKVIVWLGSGSPELVKAIRDLRSDVENRQIYHWKPALINVEYWRRVWIIQEFVLGQQVEIRCGEEIVLPDTVTRAMTRKRNTMPTGSRGRWVRVLLNFRHDWQAGIRFGDFNLLTDQIFQHPPRPQCADVRDRIFSVLSLVDPETLRRYPITVDYDESPFELLVSLVERHCAMVKTGSQHGPPQSLKIFSGILLWLLDLHKDESTRQWREEELQRHPL